MASSTWSYKLSKLVVTKPSEDEVPDFFSRKKMALTPAEKQRRYREKRKLDLERDAAYKAKELERCKQRKKISEMAPREQRIMWKKWRTWDKRRRIKSKNVALTPPSTPPPQQQPLNDSGNARRGRKVVKKNRSKVVRRNKRLMQQLEHAVNENRKWKRKYWAAQKRFQRLNKQKNNNNTPQSPVSKAKVILTAGVGISPTQFKALQKNDAVKALAFHQMLLPHIKSLLKKKSEGFTTLFAYMKKRRLNHYCGRALGYAAKIRRAKVCLAHDKAMKKLLTEFYLCDDVSRATSGIKETITRNKIKKQKRFLTSTLKKLHAKFCRIYKMKVSYSTFSRYRPFYVVPMTESNRDTCLCKVHSNAYMMASKLRSLGVIESNDTHALVKTLVCNTSSTTCMHRKCGLCKEKQLLLQLDEKLSKEITSWDQWITTSEKREKNAKTYDVKVVKKNTVTDTVARLVTEFQNSLPRLMIHVYNMKTQFKAYRMCKERLDEKSVLVHVDYSENYNCKLAEEIQAYHFGASRNQVTLHTGMVYLADEQPKPFCSVSSSMEHGPAAIWAHLDPILIFIKDKYPSLECIHFFSDGPVTQYRQKNNFYFFQTRLARYGFKCGTWSYFESSHGKGAPDGVGGALKRGANRLVANGMDIPDARTFFDLMKQHSSITLFFVPQTNVHELEKLLPNNIKTLPGTMKIHQLALADGRLMYREQSCFCPDNEWAIEKYCSCTVTHNFHVLVQEVNEDFNVEPGTSSESEENFSVHDTSSDIEPEAFMDTTDHDNPILQEVVLDSITSGTHVLVQFLGGVRKKTKFRYVGVCQGKVDEEEGDVPVMFYRVQGEKCTLFKLEPNKLFDVPFDQILGQLPKPKFIVKGGRVYYKFPESIDVFEQ